MEGSGHSPLGRWAMTIASALGCLAPGQVGLAQTPSPNRTQLTLVVSPQQQSYPGSSPSQSKEARQDPALVRARYDSDGGLASPQSGATAQSVPSPQAPTPAIPQSFPTQSVSPPQAALPQSMPAMLPVAPVPFSYPVSPPAPSNYFLPPTAAPFGMYPPAMPYGIQPSPMPYAMPYAMQPMMQPVMPVAMPAAMPYATTPAVPFAGTPPAQPLAGVGAFTNQSVSVPTSRSSSRVRVRGPGLLGSGIARLGEFMTLAGRTRIENIQETQLETPFAQPAGGVANIQSIAAAPLIAPQSSLTYPAPPPPQAQPQSVPTAPPAPTPSPQSQPHKCHFWCRHN
jgi:hypothetical protein